jgi:hypothetical protein
MTVGLLVAFAALYPDMDYIGGWIPLKWFAFVCIACGSIQFFPHHDWLGLIELWLNCFVGYAAIQYARGNFHLPRIPMPSFRPKPKFRVVPRPAPEAEIAPILAEEDAEVDSINPLLDKIAKSGIDSLTSAEREKLEKARQNLLKKGQ